MKVKSTFEATDNIILDDLSLLVPPWQRIDLSHMAKSMSTLNPFDLTNQCAKHFDIFFKTKPFFCTGSNIQRFNSMMTYLNMEWEDGNRLYKDKVRLFSYGF